MTIKTRITLFIVGTGLLSSILFSVIIFFELIEQPFDILDSVLEDEAHGIASMIVEKETGSDLISLNSISKTMDKYWIEIYEPSADKVVFKSPMADLVKLPQIKPGSGSIIKTTAPYGRNNVDHGEKQKLTFRVRTFSIAAEGRSFVVQTAMATEKLNEEIWDLVLGILAGLIFSTMLLIVISRFLAGKILQPIGQMKDLAQDISEKNLDQRIPRGEGHDEFSELAETINRMLDRLQYSFVNQKNFLFDTSHELKTPLTTIRLAVDELCTYNGENFSLLARDNLLRLKNQVLRMERLVKDLLNLSSLETMAYIDLKPVQITEILSSLEEEYKLIADAHKIKIDIRLPEKLIVPGDREKLYRAFSNILDNAIKYNIDGGRIELAGSQNEDKVTVTISNTGPGVAEDEIPKVFNQFYRSEKSRSVRHGGSGLGLAIVKRIVDLHSGTVKFESQQGGYTRVIVTIPKHRKIICP